MEASIIITGSGVNSKSTLLRACDGHSIVTKKLQYGYEIIFSSKGDAVKALSGAYQYLKSDLEDWKNAAASYKYGSSLSYDSANARIYTDNN